MDMYSVISMVCLSLVETPSGCLYPGDIENGYVIPGKDGDIFPPGKSLQFVCIEGHMRDGVEKVYCLTDETWSDVNPVCLVNEGSKSNKNRNIFIVWYEV